MTPDDVSKLARETAESVIHDLDAIARDVDHYEYGLPVCDDEAMAQMTSRTIAALTTAIERTRAEAYPLYVRVATLPVAETVELTPSVFIDYAENGAIVGIEVLGDSAIERSRDRLAAGGPT